MTHRKSSLFIAAIITIFCCISFNTYGQNTRMPESKNTASDSTTLTWLKDLYEPGVKVTDDSVILNKEAERLLKDTEYRKVMYPSVYTWDVAKEFVQKQELKKAVWFFINLYLINDINKELVVKSILTYDKLFKMEKILVSSFYTYSLTDPEIGKIEEGHSEVTAPHVLEKKLNALKAMLFYLDKYKPADRKEESKGQ